MTCKITDKLSHCSILLDQDPPISCSRGGRIELNSGRNSFNFVRIALYTGNVTRTALWHANFEVTPDFVTLLDQISSSPWLRGGRIVFSYGRILYNLHYKSIKNWESRDEAGKMSYSALLQINLTRNMSSQHTNSFNLPFFKHNRKHAL